jgi:hypothetical protein
MEIFRGSLADDIHPDYNVNARHWPITARHEAGHAVAKIVKHREAGWNRKSFDVVQIRPGAIGPYIDDRGRSSDCLGSVEGPSDWNPGLLPTGLLRKVKPPFESIFQVQMNIEVISRLAGPLAQSRAMGGNSKKGVRWHALFNGGCIEDYDLAQATISDMRAMTRRGSLGKFEGETYDLVKRYWEAINALGEALLQRHVMEYDDAFAVVEPFVS